MIPVAAVVAAAGDLGEHVAAADAVVTPVGAPGEVGAAAVETRSALEVEAGLGDVADGSDVLIPFSQVHRVVSVAIGSRFWQL